jgi:hypothetical protein
MGMKVYPKILIIRNKDAPAYNTWNKAAALLLTARYK